jgi:predicted ester cyclase
MTTTTSADLRAMFDRFIVCQRRRDSEGLAAFHTLDGVVESPMYGTLVGRAAIEEGYRAFYTSFPDANFEVEEMVVEPPQIAIFAAISATHASTFFGLAGTNRRIDFRIARLLQMQGDSIARERRIYDFTGILVQVGVLRAKPGKS